MAMIRDSDLTRWPTLTRRALELKIQKQLLLFPSQSQLQALYVIESRDELGENMHIV
jgi:hypothetical protein